MTKPATLSRSRTLSRIVIWFCTQFRRSIIFWYSEPAAPQRIGEATRITSAQCTTPS
jgi:hypothetical protein